MKELIQSILEETKNGRIQIGSRYYNLFLSNERNDIIPYLLIDSSFLELLSTYVEKAHSFYQRDPLLLELDQKDAKKLLICSVFSNASIDDFRNPCTFLKQRISFFDDSFAKKYSKRTFIGRYPLKKEIADITLSITKQSILQETPYQASVSILSKEKEEYVLPMISYGIHQKELILYAAQDKRPKKESPFLKAVKRSLYQANQGFDAFMGEASGEDLSKVSPSSLVALTVFLNMVKREGIERVKVVTYLPERYYAKEKANLLKTQLRGDDLGALEEEQRQIQNNITDKWMRNFMRMEEQIKNLKITSYPFDGDSSLHLVLNKEEMSVTPFFTNILDSIQEVESKKR